MRQTYVIGPDSKTPWNPSRSAIKRVKNPIPVPEECPVCQENAVRYARHGEVYGGREFGDWPWLLLCEGCRAYVGLHPFTGIPLGTLANEATREARKASKARFLAYMEKAELSRKQAYANLAAAMGIEQGQCHFGWFDVAGCEQAKAALLALSMTG